MASTGQYDIKNFTVSNGAITDLKELLFLSILQQGSIHEVLTIKSGVRNGKKIGGIGDFEAVGTSQKICNPTYNGSKLATVENEWKLGNMTIAEQLCADDFVETIAEVALKLGTEVGNLQDTDILNYIIEPKLSEAIQKAVWRYMFIGDVDALHVSDGGNITDTVDVKLVNAIDGIFKRLFLAVPTSANGRYVKIAANYETCKDLQRSKLLGNNVATSILDNLIYGANIKLRQRSDKTIFCTQSLADALARDIAQNNKGSNLHFESLFDGFMLRSSYNGHTILALPIWDEMIQTFEDQGDTFRLPHRAVFASKELLWGGVESAGELMPNLRIWFENKDNVTYIFGRENMGTTLWEGDLISMAY